MQGMNITIVTDAGDNAGALDLLKLMGFPLTEAKETPAKPEAKETPAIAAAEAKPEAK